MLKYLAEQRALGDPYDGAMGAFVAQSIVDLRGQLRGDLDGLSTNVLCHDDFANALRWLADEMRAKHGLIVRVHAQGPVRSPSDASKVFRYKTAQALLFNENCRPSKGSK